LIDNASIMSDASGARTSVRTNRGLPALGVTVRREDGCTMFAAHEVAIDAPIGVASTRLTKLFDAGSMHRLSDAAYDGGLETLLRVGPFGERWWLSRLVRVRTLQPIRRDETITMALRWEATGVTGELFPTLDAEFILSPDGERRSRIKLVGSYRPPFGRAGEVLDRAILTQVAEATIRSLLERVAAALVATQPAAGTTGAPVRYWVQLPEPEQP
jgi:hypothetical protein